MKLIIKALLAVATGVACIAWSLVDMTSPDDISTVASIALKRGGVNIEGIPSAETLLLPSRASHLRPQIETSSSRSTPPGQVTVTSLTGSNWRPPSMLYAGEAFGTVLTDPISSSHDPWCALELLGSPSTPSGASHRYDPTCAEEPLHQGDFRSFADVMQFQQLPRVSPLSYLDVTDEEHQLYWRDNEDPYIAHCKACAGSLVHKTLYRARRWWRLRNWRKRGAVNAAALETTLGTFMGVHKNHFSTRRGSMSSSGFDFEPVNTSIDTVVSFEDIIRIQLCMSHADSFMQFVLRGGGEIIMQQQSFLSGNRCFWRTLQLLFNATLAQRVFALENKTCSFARALTSETRVVAENSDVAMPLDRTFSFTPCYRNNMNLSQLIGKRRAFWQFTCDHMRSTEQCGQRRRIQEASSGVEQTVKVAVALSGFVSTFASARSKYIYDHLIKPHGATLFGSAYVVGRARKEIKHLKRRHNGTSDIMLDTLFPLFGIQPNETFRRLEVLEYSRHEALRANGMLFPGLYYTLARSLQLVYDSKLPFDIVIRSRFDIAPTVPLFFTRMQSASSGTGNIVEYALDVGSSCHMGGVWWPQYAKFGNGKVLKHYADTRMKYFAWQACDWMEIGTYETMRTCSTIFDWMIAGNAHAATQYVDHAFFLDHNLTYFPMQLYVKLFRTNRALFG